MAHSALILQLGWCGLKVDVPSFPAHGYVRRGERMLVSRLLVKPPKIKPAELISTKQAATRLGVSPNTVRGLIACGSLTGYRVGRLIKLDANAVEDFIREIGTGA